MAQQTIPGTRTLWSTLRGYINDNFTEIYTKLFEAGKILSTNDFATKYIPVTGATFTGEFNLSSQYDKSYLEYACNVELTPTIAAGTNLKGAYNRVVINAGASASLVATNMGTLRAGSDDFTVSKLNEIVIMQEEVDSVSITGLYYSIKVLN